MSHPASTVPSNRCRAYGCPLLGAIDSSTVGAPHWVCKLHFDAPIAHWQRVTAELRRVIWLVESIQSLRQTYHGAGWPDAYRAAQRRLIGAQRSDLAYQQGETTAQWIRRLEAELMRIARCEQTAQPQLPAVSDTWSRVELPMTKVDSIANQQHRAT